MRVCYGRRIHHQFIAPIQLLGLQDMLDELPYAFDKMHGFSIVDGFVEINDCMAEMIKYVANEPSVGLYYVQQHTQNAVPNVTSLRNNATDKSRDTTLHTEDLEDSITTVSSMKECGFLITDEMIGEIKKSLTLMSKKQQRTGIINNFQIGRTSSWGPASWGRISDRALQGRQKSAVNLFSNVFKSAKEKARNLTWPEKELMPVYTEKLLPYDRQPLPAGAASASTSSSVQDMEAEELPLSSAVVDDDTLEEEKEVSVIALVSETYEDFQSEREVKLRDWLEGTSENHDTSHPNAEL